jgi:hypothetical protein
VNVKALAANYRRWADESELIDAARAARQTATAKDLEAVAAELDAARKRLTPIPSDFGDLSDLPPEVLGQLNLTKIDELEGQMRDIIAAADGSEVGIDQIIIELYRRHKVIQERRFILNKLYRMAQKGIVHGVEGRKGLYYLPKPTASTGGWDDDLDDDIPF